MRGIGVMAQRSYMAIPGSQRVQCRFRHTHIQTHTTIHTHPHTHNDTHTFTYTQPHKASGNFIFG